MEAEDFLMELGLALGACRFGDVRGLVDGLEPGRFSEKQAAAVLRLLRRKRRFEELATAADVFGTAGLAGPTLRRLVSQALIDQGSLFHALNILRRLAPEVVDDPVEGPEVRGLIGRALKQRFVDEGDREALAEAIDAYEVDGRAAPGAHRWHGINLVACLKRAAREGIGVRSEVDADGLARGILAAIEGLEAPGVWELATAQEAAIALGEREVALRWLERYVKAPGADAFELGSTLRQLEEIWQPEAGEAGAAVVPVLRAALIRQTGGSVAWPKQAQDRSGFEAVYGKEAAQTLAWLDRLSGACGGIARVQGEASGRAVGTGFLAEGAWLNPAWGEGAVFVTNCHVVSVGGDGLRPEDALVEFTRLPGRPRVGLGELLFSSPKEALDVSVLRVEAPAGSAPVRLTEHVPVTSDAQPVRVYVVGHPGGRELEVTLYDNELRAVPPPYVRYRCPTEGGNSGSPVMNSDWKVFGLHHRADAEAQLNEGVRIASIRAAIRGS